MLYDDGGIACDDAALLIRRYYFPSGSKRVPYSSIRSVQTRPLGSLRKWRLWGSGDLVHWWNLDLRRPRKDVALELDVGRSIRPMITPDDPETVARIIAEHTGR